MAPSRRNVGIDLAVINIRTLKLKKMQNKLGLDDTTRGRCHRGPGRRQPSINLTPSSPDESAALAKTTRMARTSTNGGDEDFIMLFVEEIAGDPLYATVSWFRVLTVRYFKL